MADRNNYYKATVTLIVVGAGFLAAYPFHAYFWGGLLAGGFSAALVGGLADWFAVTALFRRPLGLKPGRIIRTEIIPRNRERIFAALVDMVQNELLSRETLKKFLDAYDVSSLIVRYLEEHGGSEHLAELLDKLGNELTRKTDPQALARLLENLLRENALKLRIAPSLGQMLEYSLTAGYVDSVISFASLQLAQIAEQPQAAGVFYQLVKDAIAVYEDGKDRRRLANELLGVSPLKLSEEIQTQFAAFLRDVGTSACHQGRSYLKQKAGELAQSLQTDSKLQGRVEEWKERFFLQHRGLRRLLTELTDRRGLELIRWLEAKVRDKLLGYALSFRYHPELQQKVDTMVKAYLIQWIDLHHDYIGTMVKESLETLSNQMLVELIESRAGNDLQIIRVNGSVVGGLAGVVIYLLTYWIS